MTRPDATSHKSSLPSSASSIEPARPAAGKVIRCGDASHDARVAVARMTLRDGQAGDEAREAIVSVRADMPESVARKMASYVPELPAEQVEPIRRFVEDAVALALPLTSYTAETLLRPSMHFAHWAVFVVGCELDALTVFDRDLIETFVREALPRGLTPGTRRNYRAWISRVAEAVNPDKNPRKPMPLNQKAMEAPYTDDDIIALDRWSAGQSTPYRRSNAAALVALGAGAGLSSIEIAHLKCEAVTVLDDGTVEIKVFIGEELKRRVVVTAEFEEIIATHVKDLAPEVFVFLPQRSRTENDVVSAFVARTLHPKRTPPVTVRRLRNTWLVAQMVNRVDVLTLMEAAGLQSLESISRLAQFVPRPTADQRDAQLRGTL